MRSVEVVGSLARKRLDAARWASYRHSRRRRGLTVVSTLVFLLLLVAWLAARR